MADPNTECAECGGEFYASPGRKKKGHGKFCSSKCYALNRQRISPTARFWKHVDKRSDDDCWLWQLKPGSHGYGQLSIYPDERRTQTAHTFSYELHNGAIPKGLVVRHRCDIRLCVNPNHLLLGTQADNNRDWFERNHGNRGTANGQSKLTVSDIRRIRADKRDGAAIAAEYGLNRDYVYKIRQGRAWAHVT